MDSRLKLQDIRLVWSYAKPKLAKLTDELGFDWQCEDVYAHCLFGKAFYYGCEDGFVVVKLQTNDFTLERELFVWICISEAGDGINEYYLDICAIAKDADASSIVFESPRPGFLQLAKRNHWQAMTSYRLPVV